MIWGAHFREGFFFGGGGEGTGACYRNFTVIRLVKRMPKISVNLNPDFLAVSSNCVGILDLPTLACKMWIARIGL